VEFNMRHHNQKPYLTFFTLVTAVFLLCGYPLSAALAQEVHATPEDNTQTEQASLYTRKGADTCLKCHDEDYKYPILPIFFSKHGNRNDPRSPMGQLQCESCHGPGRAHATEPKVGQKRAPIIAFGNDSRVSKKQQNDQCLQCHNDDKRMTWLGSSHQGQDMLCVNCHTLHVRHDPVLSQQDQAKTCYRCHKKQRAEFARPSSHPVRYEQMKCSQCHNPHGSFTDSMLKTNTKNDTCYRCHAEKRGPFLWTHAPVAEDCGLCHEHHGSSYTPLLKKRAPLLCQQCHTMAGHPSVPRDGSGLAGQNPSPFLLAKSCLNCHFQVHGSNHPSGAKLMR
jgi:DmsE family decaheme c-type cytochrome